MTIIGCTGGVHKHSQHPSNDVAVVTIWATPDKLEETKSFYKDTLGLKNMHSDPSIFDVGGTYLVVMQGELSPSKNTLRRWPHFAISVDDLDVTLESLKQVDVALPWGVEEFGDAEPNSRYVMFNDPSGNLIEVVEWY